VVRAALLLGPQRYWLTSILVVVTSLTMLPLWTRMRVGGPPRLAMTKVAALVVSIVAVLVALVVSKHLSPAMPWSG
jgi:hypothetical protein